MVSVPEKVPEIPVEKVTGTIADPDAGTVIGADTPMVKFPDELVRPLTVAGAPPLFWSVTFRVAGVPTRMVPKSIDCGVALSSGLLFSIRLTLSI